MSGRKVRARRAAAVQLSAAICVDAAEQVDTLAAVGVNELRALRSRIRSAHSDGVAEDESFHLLEALLFGLRAQASRVADAGEGFS
ncbi:hypothetical protein [uncultured Sphingomonas sp.]|uniref:hypothetical protein n=1 Tax=uncultured Sphingomonas sp. TaxID=158754 RepID=UPI003747C9A5